MILLFEVILGLYLLYLKKMCFMSLDLSILVSVKQSMQKKYMKWKFDWIVGKKVFWITNIIFMKQFLRVSHANERFNLNIEMPYDNLTPRNHTLWKPIVLYWPTSSNRYKMKLIPSLRRGNVVYLGVVIPIIEVMLIYSVKLSY